MDSNRAEQNLHTIRTLMERSALYRRALAPITMFVGGVGIAAAVAGWSLKIEKSTSFIIYWMVMAVVAIAGALVMVRRQAVKDGENFWSPPTRRVVEAMFPALFLGVVINVIVLKVAGVSEVSIISPFLISGWALLYGLALHAAGFFMPSGIRLFGWGFIAAGIALVALMFWNSFAGLSIHWIMGVVFGCSHLAYGIYLYFTEPRKNET